MSEPTSNMTPLAGGLFIASGVAFLVAAILSRQIAFTGVGISMMTIGIVFIAKAKKDAAK